MNYSKTAINFGTILFCLLPIALLSGPFISDLFLSLISVIFLIISINDRRWEYYNNFFFKFFILFYIYITLNSIFSGHPYLSLESSLFYFRFIIFSLAVWFFIENKKNILKFFYYSLLISFVIALLDGYYQYLYNVNIFGFVGPGVRMTLTMNDNLYLAGYLSRLFPLVVALAIYNSIYTKKHAFLIGLLFIATDVLVYISGERTAIALMILASIFIIIMMSKYRLIRLLTLIVSILVIIIITVMNPKIYDRNITHTIDQMTMQDDSSKKIIMSSEHDKFLLSAWAMYKDNKIFGIGPKVFRVECSNKLYSKDGNSCSTHPHNTYIQVLAETGIVGLIFFLTIIFYLISISLRHLYQFNFVKKNYKNYLLSDYQICLIGCFFLTLWPFIPTLNFFNNWISIIYYLPVGFYLSSIYEKK